MGLCFGFFISQNFLSRLKKKTKKSLVSGEFCNVC